ncbi:LacI family DNA-binding transcriptional regulator [Microbacterium tumbae]
MAKFDDRPSMADVGREAEVSAQTVSRYFTGGYISDQARERVERAVAKLGYRHNRLARNLRVQRTDTIGFLIMGPLNYGNAEILTGVTAAARGRRLSVITTQLFADPSSPDSVADVRGALDHFLSFRVDGIIAGTPYLEVDRQLSEYAQDVALVTLSEAAQAEADVAGADSYGAATLAMRHLVELGHTRILHVAGPLGRIEAEERVRAYGDVLADAGIEPLPILRCREWESHSGAAHGATVDPGTFTAVFAANDVIALGFMGAMEERGLRAPRDYSIAGIDGMPDAGYFSPPLSTAVLDFQELGRTAVEMLEQRIRASEPQEHVIIPPAFIARASTQPLPRS